MKKIESKLKEFLTSVSSGNGYGHGYGDGNGNGRGHGYGNGRGDGNGDGSGDGYGDGSGDGYGNGDGSGDGSGDGYGHGYGIISFCGDPVVYIDSTKTVVSHIKGKILQGYILDESLRLTPCFVVKEKDVFAHGESLKKAYKSLKEKILLKNPIEDRIQAFVDVFEKGIKYKAEEFYNWHFILTGSCQIGRDIFLKENDISLSSKMTVKEFIEKTEDKYQGDIIKQLKLKYK